MDSDDEERSRRLSSFSNTQSSSCTSVKSNSDFELINIMMSTDGEPQGVADLKPCIDLRRGVVDRGVLE